MPRSKHELAVASLLGNSALTRTDIASILGISRHTVQNIVKKIKDLGEGTDVKLADYRRHLEKGITQSKKVKTLQDLIGSHQNPFARLKTVEYVDTMLGLHPKTRPDEAETSPKAPPALFELPAGAHIQVSIDTPAEIQAIDRRPLLPDMSPPVPDMSPTIDIETEPDVTRVLPKQSD